VIPLATQHYMLLQRNLSIPASREAKGYRADRTEEGVGHRVRTTATEAVFGAACQPEKQCTEACFERKRPNLEKRRLGERGRGLEEQTRYSK